MKKLLIASMAAALTAGAWAADTYTKTQEGFEDTSFSTDGWDTSAVTSDDTYTPTAYASDSEKYTYGVPEANTAAISGGPGSQYLKLETASGAVLRRNFAENAGAVTVDADTSYVVDTLVKFTATDEAPTVADGDKFILWLKSTEGSDNTTTYSLMATCGTIDAFGGIPNDESGNPITATVALNAAVTAETWARISVKTIATGNGGGVLGFVVYVDGAAVAVSDGDAYAELFADDVADYNAEAKAYRTDKKLLPCLVGGDANNGQTLTSVGFEGTGAIDDLLIAKTGDGAPSFTDWSAPVVSYTVSFTAVGLADGTTWSMEDVTVTSGGTVAEQTAPDVTGYKLVGWYSDSTCETPFVFGETTISEATTIYVKYEEEAAADPVAPGQTVEGSSAEAAEAALKAAGIASPFKGITDEQQKAYADMFTVKTTQISDSEYTAEWVLTAAAVETLETSANNALATTLSGVLDSESTSVSLTTDVQPGFYYSVLSATTVDATTYEAAGWTMAEGDSVTLTLPAKDATATQGFYKVGVSAVNPTVE